jgi:hypothetical protein
VSASSRRVRRPALAAIFPRRSAPHAPARRDAVLHH